MEGKDITQTATRVVLLEWDAKCLFKGKINLRNGINRKWVEIKYEFATANCAGKSNILV